MRSGRALGFGKMGRKENGDGGSFACETTSVPIFPVFLCDTTPSPFSPPPVPTPDDHHETLTALVPLDHAGRRFDQALAELFPQFSRSRLAAWIKDGNALLDGRTLRPRDAVQGGETVSLTVVREVHGSDAPEDLPLTLLHQDADVLVVDKPVGLVVHPGAGNPTGTLVNALLHHFPELSLLPRAGIVHRLDKDTSGALIVARTLEAHTSLVAQLAERSIHRRYEAVVLGVLVAGGTVDAPIGRHPHDRLRMAVVEDGKQAVTHYRVRARYRAHTRLQVDLETGRTHQIRVHMAHIGHPLLGDAPYGGGRRLPKGASPELVEALRGFRRQALHAERVEFAHPASGAPVVAESPRPADLAALIRTLAADTPG